MEPAATAREPALIPEAERRRLLGTMENRLYVRALLAGRDPAEYMAEFAARWEMCLRCGGWREIGSGS